MAEVKVNVLGEDSASPVFEKVRKNGDSAFKKLEGSAVSASGRIKSAFHKLKENWIAVTAALAAGIAVFSKLTGVIIDFEKSMAEVSTLVDTAAVSMSLFKDRVIDTAVEIGKRAIDLSKGLYQVISAGIGAGEAIDVLRVSAKASVAGLTDTFTAVDIITTALNSYELSARDATRVSDILFTTIRLGKTTFPELAGALGQVFPFTSQLKISLEEVSGAMATLTARGLSTKIAATSLRALSVSFIQNAAIWKAAGIDILKVLEEEGIAGAMRRLNNITGGNTIEMKKFINETEALTAGLTLAGSGYEDFIKNTEAAKNATGATDIAFAKMSDTLDHMIDITLANLDKLLIKIGDKSMPGLHLAINTATVLIIAFTDSLEDLSTIFWGVAGGIAAMGLASLPALIGGVSTAFAGLSASVAALGTGVAIAMPQVVAIAALLTGAYIAATKFWQGIDRLTYGLTGIDLSGLNELNAIMADMKNLEVPAEVVERQAKMLKELGFTGEDAMARFKMAVEAGVVTWDKLANKWITGTTKAEQAVAAISDISKALDKVTPIAKSAGGALLSFAGDKFKDDLKSQESSVEGMVNALGAYLTTMDAVYKMRVDQIQVVNRGIEGELVLTEVQQEQAQNRLAAWSQYYNTLVNLHDKAVKDQLQKSKELLDLETQIKDQRQGYADIQLSLSQKLMTETQRYYSTQKDLEERYKSALTLTGQAKIDALTKYQTAMAATASAVSENGEVQISLETTVANALEKTADAQAEILTAQDALKAAKQAEIDQIGVWKTSLETAMSKASEMMELYKAQVVDLGYTIASLQTDIALNVDNAQAMTAINSVKDSLNSIPDVTYKQVVITTVGGSSTGSSSGGGFQSDSSMAGFHPQPLATGTPYVKNDGLFYLHKGEAVIPASQNNNNSRKTTISISAPIQIIGSDKDGKQLARELDGELAALVRNARSQLARELK